MEDDLSAQIEAIKLRLNEIESLLRYKSDRPDKQRESVIKFVEEKCSVEDGQFSVTTELYERFKDWALDSGRCGDVAPTHFGRILRTISPKIRTKQVRQGYKTFRVFQGIGNLK